MSTKKEETKKKEETNDSFLKKYWFVLLVSILLVVFIGMYAKNYVDSLPVTVDSKNVDGKDVIYDLDGDSYYADDLYEDLYATSGVSMEYNAFMAAVLNAYYETTSEMQTVASNMANYYIQTQGESTLVSSLQSMGYYNGISDLTTYYITYQKNLKMLREYYTEHYEEYAPSYIEENNQKAIYHILVKVADVTESTDESGNTVHTANPTDDEKAKLNAVLEALKTQDFEEVAKQYSDDGTASEGGYLGVLNDDTAASTYVAEFADGVAALNYDETSEVITSTYGYHIIMVKMPTKEQALADDTFIQNLNNNYTNMYSTILMEKADEVGYEIYDEKLKSQIQTELDAAKEEE